MNKRNLALGVVSLVGTVVIVVLALVIVFGGSSAEGIDTDKAGPQSKAALLQPADLPGGVWKARQENTFSETPSSRQSPACLEQKAANDDILAAKPNLVDRAEREMGLTNIDPPLVVDEWVEVYKTADNVKDLMPKVQRLMGDSMVTCTGEGLGQGVKATRGTPRVAAPSGGQVIAIDFRAPNAPTGLHSEYYYWQSGNVAISLTINGQDDKVTTDLVKTAIEKAQASLKKAAGSK